MNLKKIVSTECSNYIAKLGILNLLDFSIKQVLTSSTPQFKRNPMVNIEREKLVKILDEAFVSIALEDIKRALHIDTNTTMAVFILGSCFIEALGGFYCGQTNPNLRGKSQDQFVQFVTKYLPQYNPHDLWQSLRNGLVHSYTDKGKYLFVNKKRDLHHSLHQGRGLFINDENFVEELENAYKQFREDILNNNDIFFKAKRRFDAFGVTHILDIPKNEIDRGTSI